MSGIAFTPAGDLLVSSQFDNTVLRFDGVTGGFVGVFSSGGGLASPAGLEFGPDGNLHVASSNTGQVLRYDGATGAFLSVFANVGLTNPRNFTFGPDGNLYVVSIWSHEVLRFNGSTGSFMDAFVPSGSGLSYPIDLVFPRNAVPEPSSAMFIAVGCLILAFARHRNPPPQL